MLGMELSLDETLERLKQLERAFSPQVAAAVIESLPDAILVVSEEGEILLANAQTELMFGYPRSSLHGHKVEMLIPESVRSAHEKHRESFSHDPRVRAMGIGMVLKAQHRSGKQFEVEINLSPIVTDSGILTIALIRKAK